MENSNFTKIKENLGPLGANLHFDHHYISYLMLEGDINPFMTFNEINSLIGRSITIWVCRTTPKC